FMLDYCGRVPRRLTKKTSERYEGSYRQCDMPNNSLEEIPEELHEDWWSKMESIIDFGDNFIDPTTDVGKADIGFLQDNEYTN
ncbi:7907_t:CDS:2, partial [Ambispora leptoticha]